jgi:hypothetical protein
VFTLTATISIPRIGENRPAYFKCFRFPAEARDFSLFQNLQTSTGTHQHWDSPALGPTQNLIRWVPSNFFFRGKRSERDGYNSYPSSAEVKNEWSCISIPLICHPIVNRVALPFVEMCRLHSLLRYFTLQYPHIISRCTQIFQNSMNEIKSLSAKR